MKGKAAIQTDVPPLVRLGMDQWTPDLIWFNGTQVVRTPNYYIQQMFAGSLGDQLIESSLTDESGAVLQESATGLYHTVSKTADGRVYIKLVNVSGEEKRIALQVLNGGFSAPLTGTMTLLNGGKQDVNSLGAERIAPVELPFTGDEVILPGYAAAVLALPAGR